MRHFPAKSFSQHPRGEVSSKLQEAESQELHHHSPTATPGPSAPGNGGSLQGKLSLEVYISALGVMVTSCICCLYILQNFYLLLTYQSLTPLSSVTDSHSLH